MKRTLILSTLLGLGLAWGWAAGARADDAGDATAALDARVSALEQRLSLLNPVSGTSTSFQGSPASAFASADRGIGFVSSDGSYGIQFGGTLQEDLREYFDSGLNNDFANTKAYTAVQPGEFVLARARLLIDAFLGSRVHVRYQEDFSNNGTNSGSSAQAAPSAATYGAGAELVDAYGELRLLPWTLLRVGQFKTGLDIERWRQTPALEWIQYGYTAGLSIDRDQGAELEIADPKQVLYLAGGVFDGDTDTGSNPVVNSVNPNKDLITRLFIQPFNGLADNKLGDFGAGAAISAGNHSQDPEQPYKTLGQLTDFNAPSALGNALTSYTVGAGYRLVPQAYWFWKQFDLIGEYSREWNEYRVGAALDGVAPGTDRYADSEAWDAGLGWVITGEKDTYNGIKLDKNSHAWGALQLVARVEGENFDEGEFTTYKPGTTPSAADVASIGLVDPLDSVKRLTSWSVGLNYIPVNDVKFLLDYDVTQFTGGGEDLAAGKAVAVNRPTEEALQGRVQFAF